MKYLPKETCEYLVSLGCVPDGHWWYVDELMAVRPDIRAYALAGGQPSDSTFHSAQRTPAFSLDDLLRKENLERVAWKLARSATFSIFREVTSLVWENPDTWPEEVARIIQPPVANKNQEEKG